MKRFRRYAVTDLNECERLWRALIPVRNISDQWDFRFCFHRHFKTQPYFLILEDHKGIAAMLPLSFVEELDRFVFFPGETWHQKTWLERTPVFLREQRFFSDLLSACPEKTHLRYLENPACDNSPDINLDETGYVLYPGLLECDFDRYRKRFSGKRFKEIVRVVRSFTGEGSVFHLNRMTDFDRMVEMSLNCYGGDSYLENRRFRESFREVLHLLHRQNRLRMVSLEINGLTAAVDLGALFQNTYTVFLGGTHHDFKGIAKAMNMHHLQFAFENNMEKIDFLCGDFNWKKIWHLDPEPLYTFLSPALAVENDLSIDKAEEQQPRYFAEATTYA